MENKKMLYAWMVIIVLFLLFLAYNINSKAVPQALLAITIAIAVAINFFAEKERFEDEQIVPYFLKNGDQVSLLNTSTIDDKEWSQKFSSLLNIYLLHYGNEHKDRGSFKSEDITEMVILFCLHNFFKDAWCYSNYKEYSVPLSDISLIHYSFNEKKKFTIITDNDIRKVLLDNSYIKYSMGREEFSFCVPPGTKFFRERNKDYLQGIEINIRKPLFFNITIKIKPLIGSKNLSFLNNYFKPATPNGGRTCLALIHYEVEFGRLVKGSSVMEDYRKWAYNVVSMLKGEITDLDDLKRKYVEYRILYPEATY